MVGRSGGVAVLRCGTAATASPDADSGTPCGQQVFGAHNDVGAGTGGQPAGADREEARTAGMGDDVTGARKLGHLGPVDSAPLSPFDGAHGGDVVGGAGDDVALGGVVPIPPGAGLLHTCQFWVCGAEPGQGFVDVGFDRASTPAGPAGVERRDGDVTAVPADVFEVAGDETEPESQVGIGEPVPAQPAVGCGPGGDFDTDQVLGAFKDLQRTRDCGLGGAAFVGVTDGWDDVFEAGSGDC